MKSKNIPADISNKTIKESQNEIKDIIDKLESIELNTEDSRAKYNRMIQLNNHIQDKFKQKANEIRESIQSSSNKKFVKNKK
tara:strand:- start:226 stop:471 length:246 start_codon:yes stop_codon:yes gene_type:complete